MGKDVFSVLTEREGTGNGQLYAFSISYPLLLPPWEKRVTKIVTN